MRTYLLAITIGLAMSSAHAGIFDSLNAISQIAANVSSAGKVTTDATPSTATAALPIATTTLAQMDCPALEVAALNSSRELELVKANIEQIDSLNNNPQYQQQKAASSAIGALGSLLANKGGKTGEYAQAAQQLGNASATPAELNLDAQLGLGKKYMSDLDNIRIYQKHKKCS
ncbi:hypothetical protein BKE30_12855 [Alkanindiges hydrocarboniclasticus]|uniref:Uncharacterized protein n=1 Tax=Alkanindiges hydrocarboniclasticus TaxID=1907941 RepID=A0A1S8CRG0_9GAMM|nr:hypothetical protein [Alkanindiges hydrocarboniclasticus]ONG38394.1 hypothetical protein BKE30_12855 [Alkanindiges hydrocarboniclasticus]